MKKLGLYIHAPFCFYKCLYCDFYSVKYDELYVKEYCSAVCARLKESAPLYSDYLIDTVYFGGGTPNLLGLGLIDIIKTVKDNYNLYSNPEITVEANPFSVTDDIIKCYADNGVNRFSFGMQSANCDELKKLGRRHSTADIEKAVSNAKTYGTEVSLDMMLATSGQTKNSLKNTIDFANALDADHISAYILKVENGTPYHRMQLEGKLDLPDEDETAELYLFTCDQLAKAGYLQYEISNFARNGKLSKHNLKYWHCEEYLGIGPSAHSFVGGKRFYYRNSIKDFIDGGQPESEGEGGGFAEYVMLGLRLTEGLEYETLSKKYPHIDLAPLMKEAAKFPSEYLFSGDYGLRLSQNGFLISNTLIYRLLNAYL